MLCALVLASACLSENPDTPALPDTTTILSDPAGARIDTLVAAMPSESLVATPDITRAAPDSAPVEIEATAQELEDLAGRLMIPVARVRPGDLRDTFTESRGTRPHDAIDIPAPRGTSVVSGTGGVLRKLHNSIPGGLMVYAADETDRFILMYGHLDGYAVGLTEGMRLTQGQVLGYVGTTGNAPPDMPHLHFAIARGRPSANWSRGMAVNPYPLLVRARTAPSR